MGLTDWGPVVVLGTLLVTVVAAVLLGWDRWPRPLRWPARGGFLVLSMLLAIILTGDVVNRDYGFYSSWADLFSSPSDNRFSAAAVARHQQLPAADVRAGEAAAALGQGTIVKWRFAGARSGIIRDGFVYLPAAYYTNKSLRFPVLELFHGYAGSPTNWTSALSIASVLDTEIAAGRMPPVIAVMPKIYQGYDGQCVDAVNGQRNETYLAIDVPAVTAKWFRTATAPRSWATMGFSTGAYCAVNLALHHQSTYRAAISLSGYFYAASGNLFHKSKALVARNSPSVWVRHNPVTVSIYAFVTAGDRGSWKETMQFQKAFPAGGDLTMVTAPGGHSIKVWKPALAPALDWLGQRLPQASTPPLVESGAVSQPAVN